MPKLNHNTSSFFYKKNKNRKNMLMSVLDGSYIKRLTVLEQEDRANYANKELQRQLIAQSHDHKESKEIGLITAIILSWGEMTPKQKIVSVVLLLTLCGFAFSTAYKLLPYFKLLLDDMSRFYNCAQVARRLTPRQVLSRHALPYTEDSAASLKEDSASKIIREKKSEAEHNQEMLVSVDNRLHQYVDKLKIKNPKQSSALKTKILNRVNYIKELIPQLSFHPDAIDSLILTGLEIMVMDTDEFTKMTAEGMGGVGTRGIYLCDEHVIIIPLESTKRELRGVLQNELFHALTKVANLSKVDRPDIQCEKHSLSFPFLDNQGEIDPISADKLHQAILEYSKNFQLFANLYQLDLHQKSLPAPAQNFYEELKNAIIKRYQPKLHFITIKAHIYAILEESIKKGRLKQAKNSPYFLLTTEQFPQFGFSSNYWIDVSNILESTEGEFILQCCLAGHGLPNDKLHIFIEDTKIIFNDYLIELEDNQEAHPTEDSIYQSFSHFKRLSELSSEIQTLPTEIKKILCPLWCKFISEYMAIDDYCSSPSYSAKSP